MRSVLARLQGLGPRTPNESVRRLSSMVKNGHWHGTALRVCAQLGLPFVCLCVWCGRVVLPKLPCCNCWEQDTPKGGQAGVTLCGWVPMARP